ncbi:MAG: VWA domain-containing protein [Streptosporangiaceae bacterium]
MPRRARPLDPEHNPVHRFAQELREVHRRAGKPTRAWLGTRMNCSHATVSHVLNGDRFPSWQHTAALITACGDDPERLRSLWLETDTALEQAHHVPTSYRPLGHGQVVMPIYLVCDVSGSMGGGQIDGLNHAVAVLVTRVSANPLLADLIRFCLITFSDHATELLPLTDVTAIEDLPAMSAQGSTCYGTAFGLLREVIERDGVQLKADGYQLYRPVVFFITDGEPVDKWEDAHHALTDASWGFHPHVLAFGLGDVSESTIRRIATFKGFFAREAASPVAALEEFMSSLTRSMVVAAPHPVIDPSVRTVLFNMVEGITELEGDQPADRNNGPRPLQS